MKKNFGKNANSLAGIFKPNDIKIPVFDNINDKSDWVKLDRKKVEWVFEKGGFLEKTFAQFEVRAGQVKMSGEVVEAFNSSKHLMVEAGYRYG